MNTVRRIFKNSGASLLARVSTPVSSFLIVYFIARYSGVSGLGTFSSALSLFYIFQAFCSLGFSYLITRNVAQNKSKAMKYLVNASFLGIVFSLSMIPIMCVVVNLITDNITTIKAVYILSISLVPYSLGSVCEAISRAFEKLEYIAISQVLSNAFKVIIGVFLLFKGYGLVFLMTAVLASYFLYFFLNLFLALSCIPKKSFQIDFSFCKFIMGAIPVFAMIFILNTVRWNLDMLILTKMMSENEVGLFGAATRLMNIGKLGLGCYIFAIQPVIFRLYKSSVEKFSHVCQESIRYLLILLIPIAVATTLLSKRFILLVFKAEFEPAAHALNILIWILVFSGENLIFANALVASDRQNINLKGNFINLISNISLNLLLIPKLGFIGASIASFISSLIMFIYQYYYVSKFLFPVNYFHHAKKPIIASMVMGLAILLFGNLNLFFILIISITIYFLCLLALKAFTKKDKELLAKLFSGKEDLKASEGIS